MLKTKKKIKLKKTSAKILKVIGIIFLILLGIFCFYRYNVNELKKIGYSEDASKNIIFMLKKSYVLSVGENKTLNAAFESDFFIEDNIDSYAKIKYQEQKHLIQNINKLINKKYSNSDISLILSHGNDKEVTEFAKRDKVRYLEEFFSFDLAKLEYYDRYVNYSDLTGEDDETTVLHVNLDMDKEDYTDPMIVDSYDVDLLVNKHRQLSNNYVPNDLIEVNSKYRNDDIQKGSKVAVNAFIQMAKAAEKQGLGIIINSGYRSYEEQEELCESYASLYGQSYVDRYVAKPGFSEHQTGFAFDIGSTTSNVFANSKEFTWIVDNAHKYGFIQRFPKNQEDITGFRYESWHYRYVGKDIAKYIYDNKISFDEYYIRFLDNN